MANKTLAKFEGLAVPAIFAAVLAKDDVVKISGNATVAKAAAGDKPLGQVTATVTAANQTGTVETKFKALVEIKGSGALAANAEVKLAAADGSGNQQVIAFTEGTATVDGDAEMLRFGRVWVGGADGATLKVMTY